MIVAAGCATDTGSASPSTASEQNLRVDVQWRTDLASDRGWEIDPREMGTPVMAPGGDLLVGASNGWVYRIVPHSGQPRWAVPVDGAVEAAARLEGQTVFVGTDVGELVALDWSDGSEQWRHATRGSIESRPTVADGRVFVTDSEDRLYAVDAATGDRLWDFQHEAPEFFTIKGGGEPLVVDDVVYTGFADGHLVALFVDTGDEVWSVYLGDQTGEFGDIDLPLFEHNDELVAVSHAGGIYSVERQTGALLWHLDRSDVAGVDRVEHVLFAATTVGDVIAVDLNDGEVAWEYELPDGQAGMDVSVAAPFVTVATARGPLYWLDLQTGQPRRGWQPSTGFQSAPVFDNRYGYVMSNRGYLYGFSLAY